MTKVTYTLQPGSTVYYQGIQSVIIKLLDLESALIQLFNTNEIKRANIVDLSSDPATKTNDSSGIGFIPDEDWQIAQRRLEVIQPLLNMIGRTKKDVVERANQFELHTNTLYKWLRLYEDSGLLTSLMPKKRTDAGTTKLDEAVEAIIESCIETDYLTKQKKSITSLYNTIKRKCSNANLTPPHCNTVRNRVGRISDELKLRRRFGGKKADELYRPNEGAFPNADYPLAVTQIDHTLLDIILVDDEYRLPLDRPWITLFMDVYSRMVLGFYISFDPPGALATGLSIAHGILPKDKWLAQQDIATSWPVWGIPKTIHADNAQEFRGNMLKRACEEYGINIEWRPVARPHFGGHVERLLGTFAKEIHTLPGTTFSNINERIGYDAAKHSAMTLKELERWMAIYITEVYHQRLHTGIHMPPIQKYEEGIFGSNKTKGVGLPAKITDEQTLWLNFLPYEERTIQEYGVVIDEIHYYHDVLRTWINSRVKGKSKLKRKFFFRRDPRDISIIWFFDPELNTYFPIPYRNTAYPAMSIWELRKVRREMKKAGQENINESLIFEAYDRMREVQVAAEKETKKSRRAIQKRKSAGKAIKPSTTSYTPNVMPVESLDTEDDLDIVPFDEMEELNKDE